MQRDTCRHDASAFCPSCKTQWHSELCLPSFKVFVHVLSLLLLMFSCTCGFPRCPGGFLQRTLNSNHVEWTGEDGTWAGIIVEVWLRGCFVYYIYAPCCFLCCFLCCFHDASYVAALCRPEASTSARRRMDWKEETREFSEPGSLGIIAPPLEQWAMRVVCMCIYICELLFFLFSCTCGFPGSTRRFPPESNKNNDYNAQVHMQWWHRSIQQHVFVCIVQSTMPVEFVASSEAHSICIVSGFPHLIKDLLLPRFSGHPCREQWNQIS